ncbi:MAG: glycosyltransferase [Chitinophagaceae bacterium]|nr:glycosyltransferase [Chitinophagaceae bacterium]
MSDKPTIVFLGPSYPYRGGIASFTERLAREFQISGIDCLLFTFSLQYPSFLFPGKTQYSNEARPKDLRIKEVINTINPLNWLRVGRELKRLAPDFIIVRYWLPFMAPAFGTILRIVKQNKHTKVICIADNIIPHEKRIGDKMLTSYFNLAVDGYIAMSEQVQQDIATLGIDKPVQLLHHPLFDHFGDPVERLKARNELGIDHQGGLLLFFGFIRHYKGLDLLLEAMADHRIKEIGLKLVIAGEFYEDQIKYTDLIRFYQLEDQVILFNEFIPEQKIRYFFSAADVLVQPYRHATQSGVTPLSIHFELPMIVTDAGGLKEMVIDKVTGLVVQKDPVSIANAILAYFQKGKEFFIPALVKQKNAYSWPVMAKGILAFWRRLKSENIAK